MAKTIKVKASKGRKAHTRTISTSTKSSKKGSFIKDGRKIFPNAAPHEHVLEKAKLHLKKPKKYKSETATKKSNWRTKMSTRAKKTLAKAQAENKKSMQAFMNRP